jgi:F-type H+-transporting ATPase subunit gamma
MEQLIIMKQRIKTVETIKKVTHAMRLISMSSHTRLLEKRKDIVSYKKACEKLWSSVYPSLPASSGYTSEEPKELVILVGSQKGLCGGFNTSLFKFFEGSNPKASKHTHLIAVGQFSADYLKRHKINPVASYPVFTLEQFIPIAQAISDLIMSDSIKYKTVTVYHTIEKTFFVQQPRKTVIYPFNNPSQESDPQEYLFEQSPELLRDMISNLLLFVSLQNILFESLLSEQAARFISMDTSTRNADNLITSMKLGYNKIRQASITRELSELSATLSS